MLNDSSLSDGLELRPAQEKDQAFMGELFRSTREFLYLMPIPRQQIDILVNQQYRLQQDAYAGRFPNAYTLIIQLSGKAVGKIILDEGETAWHIIDITLIPGVRGKGHGTSILHAIQARAQKHQMPVKLSVDRQNPLAKKLYLRLGFQVEGMSDTHESMNWSPSIPAASGDFFTQNRNSEPVKSVF
jgi:ribosomal protein S18 acetylase RimI-like enzyme